MNTDQSVALFQMKFNTTPDEIIRAPGRVNLIGEHTDYNEGFVLPIAIDKEVRIALSKTNNRNVVLYSQELKSRIEFLLDDLHEGSGWGEYIKGVAWALRQEGYKLKGWQGVLTSEIPQGAGLSSSAAVEMATVEAFVFSSGLTMTRKEMARIGRKAENEWVGVKSGIMDQMTSANGMKDHALLIDCKSLEITKIPLPVNLTFVVLDTMTRHKLVESAYNERREQCRQAAQLLRIHSLREIEPKEFKMVRNRLDKVIAKRAQHVVDENYRVIDAIKALEERNNRKFGELVSESHISLRDLFEVSSPELNSMVNCATQQSGCLGARMMGAGFGGSAIAIVENDHAADFVKSVRDCYKDKTGIDADIYPCKAVDGVEILPFD